MKRWFYLLFCMGRKLGILHWEKNMDGACFRTGDVENILMEEIAEDWRKFHNEELHNYTLYELLSGWWNQEGWDEWGR
jgi:hypothetical protein